MQPPPAISAPPPSAADGSVDGMAPPLVRLVLPVVIIQLLLGLLLWAAV